MKNMILSILALLFLISCAPGSGNSGGPGPLGPIHSDNKADMSVCNSGTATSIEGRWKYVELQGEDSYTTILTVAQNQAQLSYTCKVEDDIATVFASSPAMYDGSTFSTLQKMEAKSESKSRNKDGRPLTCSFAMEPFSAPYAFVGRCLYIGTTKDVRTLWVPVESGFRK